MQDPPPFAVSASKDEFKNGLSKQYKTCVLALDHDRCGKFIQPNATGMVAGILKELAELLQAKVGKGDECHYTLVSYSNRQSDAINWYYEATKTGDLKRNLTHLADAKAGFEQFGLKITEVYAKYFLETKMNEFGTLDNFDVEAYRNYASKDAKRSLRVAIEERYASPDTIIVYIDDDLRMLPSNDELPVEEDKYSDIGWIQFYGTMTPGQVRWMERVTEPVTAKTVVTKL
jgi:hypothetical protein|tara:strand:+ start:383 stop:1075 length:693 start_codon:yes stop_codon:yes gene_type:complete